jgi:hypothetical protein
MVGELQPRLDSLKERVGSEYEKYRKQMSAIRIVAYRRIQNLSKENEFWRNFLKALLATSMKEGVDANKICRLFFAQSGIKLDKALADYEQEELEYLLTEKSAERPARLIGV